MVGEARGAAAIEFGDDANVVGAFLERDDDQLRAAAFGVLLGGRPIAGRGKLCAADVYEAAAGKCCGTSHDDSLGLC